MLAPQVSQVGNAALVEQKAITLPQDHAFGFELADVAAAAIELLRQCRRADGRGLSGSRSRDSRLGDGRAIRVILPRRNRNVKAVSTAATNHFERFDLGQKREALAREASTNPRGSPRLHKGGSRCSSFKKASPIEIS